MAVDDDFDPDNPFPEPVMREVIAALAQQGDPNREIVIIYNAPTCHALLVAQGFRPLRDYPDQWGNGIRVYANPRGERRLKRP